MSKGKMRTLTPHKVTVEVGGFEYELQHPGNREWVRLQTELMDMRTQKPDLVALMDYCFEHVVSPVGHEFWPTLDTVSPAEVEVWGKIFLPFLRGGVVDAFAPSKRDEPAQPVAEPAALLAENNKAKGDTASRG